MAFNPMMIMQIKNELEKFNARHPKLQMFFANVVGQVQPDDVLEISVTRPDGNKVRTNIKITSEDTELIKSLVDMIAKGK